MCARGGKQAAWVCATAVLMSGKVWPIQGTASTVAERLAGSSQVRRYIMSCEQVGNSIAGSGAVSKTSAPTSCWHFDLRDGKMGLTHWELVSNATPGVIEALIEGLVKDDCVSTTHGCFRCRFPPRRSW